MMENPADEVQQKLALLAQGYVARLQASVGELRAVWVTLGPEAGDAASASDALARMRRQSHKLSGSGATFGLPRVSDAARDMELYLDGLLETPAPLTLEQHRKIDHLIGALEDAARSAQGDAAEATPEPTVPAAGDEPSPAAEPAPEEERRDRPVVFLVDDDLDVSQDLALKLSQYSYEVHVFAGLGGIEELVDRVRPAAIIMDIMFPEGSLAGTDVITDLQRGRPTPVPVIFISARQDLNTRREALRAGGHAYFTKPVDVPALVVKLDLIARSRSGSLEALRQGFERELTAAPRMFGQYCVERGWITQQQLEEALADQREHGGNRMLGDVFVARGRITIGQKLEALTQVYDRQIGAKRKGLVADVCIERGWVTAEELAAARSKITREGAGDPLDVLVAEGRITERQRAEARGLAWDIPFVDLDGMELDIDLVRELMKTLSPDVCRRLKAIPFQRTRRRVRIAMANPLDVFAQDEIKALLGRDLLVDLAIATDEGIYAAIGRASADAERLSPMLDQIMEKAGEHVQVAVAKDERQILDVEAAQEMTGAAPVVALCDGILLRGIQEKASDIHLQPNADGLAVRLRMDGVLRDVLTVPRDLRAPLVSRFKLLADLDIANRLIPQDGRISVVVQGKPYDLRVSSLPSVWGEEIVIRILDKSSAQVGMEKLGLTPEVRDRLERVSTASYGLILVTGPTGSGKTTTLYSLLNRLNVRDRKVVTVEDPVEYQLPGLSQVQANPVVGLTFAAALRSFLRQDPDIIMVGEIRDLEVARIALEAALTGHLVLSTVHTNDAPSAVTRLTEMGIESFLVASTLIGVLAQRLVRRTCERCKEAYEPDIEALRRLGFVLEEGEKPVFYRGRGCEACHGSGYRGRLGVYELLTMSDTLRQLVMQGAPAHQLQAAARAEGMATLQDDGMLKIRMGLTTLEEALRVLATA